MDILSLCRRMVMLFFCMACGFCAAKGGVMDTQSNKKLSALVVNVANPMQILASALTGERLLSTGQTLRLAGLIVLICHSFSPQIRWATADRGGRAAPIKLYSAN